MSKKDEYAPAPPLVSGTHNPPPSPPPPDPAQGYNVTPPSSGNEPTGAK